MGSQKLSAVQIEEQTKEEIDEIISEIEDIQKEVASQTTTDEAAASNTLEEFRAGETSTPLEETLLPERSEMPENNVTPFRTSQGTQGADTADGVLTMRLTGNMTLKLSYECGDQEVSVGFYDNCLKVNLADGTEFKIPIRKARL